MKNEHSTNCPPILHWFKSSYSGSDGGDCVEAALAPTTVHIRDSKAAPGPVLHVSNGPWRTFLSFVGS